MAIELSDLTFTEQDDIWRVCGGTILNTTSLILLLVTTE
jgi:hypothetical protein